MSNRTAQYWKCPGCGDEINAREECESWPCANCGTEMEPKAGVGGYLLEDLEDLVEHLRQRANDKYKNSEEAFTATQRAAEDIEEIVEVYKDGR